MEKFKVEPGTVQETLMMPLYGRVLINPIKLFEKQETVPRSISQLKTQSLCLLPGVPVLKMLQNAPFLLMSGKARRFLSNGNLFFHWG